MSLEPKEAKSRPRWGIRGLYDSVMAHRASQLATEILQQNLPFQTSSFRREGSWAGLGHFPGEADATQEGLNMTDRILRRAKVQERVPVATSTLYD